MYLAPKIVWHLLSFWHFTGSASSKSALSPCFSDIYMFYLL
jgi:hypothetical protein